MNASLEETLRVEGGQVLATLIRVFGDFDLAQDALQDATVVALEKWGSEGVPANPGAWLTTVSRNKALDRLRREARRKDKESAAAVTLVEHEPVHEDDDRLRLMFTCCHPALSPEARVALTLRTICGLTTGEIARAFLVADSTMGQRISRAKKKIAVAKIPYRVPEDHELPDRLPAVLAAIYVIFTTGHHATEGSLDARVALSTEAIRLGRILAELMPDEPEVHGLLALMLATWARRRARLDGGGEMVLLADQDRALWDHEAIAEAAGMVDRTLKQHRVGPYQVQAAIACLHGLAPSDAGTDWKQIADLYRMLETLNPGPVVRVNRSVAESKVFGPEAGLALLADVAGVEDWHLYWSTRAHLEYRAGRRREAAADFRRALDCPMNDTDRRFLTSVLSRAEAGTLDT